MECIRTKEKYMPMLLNYKNGFRKRDLDRAAATSLGPDSDNRYRPSVLFHFNSQGPNPLCCFSDSYVTDWVVHPSRRTKRLGPFTSRSSSTRNGRSNTSTLFSPSFFLSFFRSRTSRNCKKNIFTLIFKNFATQNPSKPHIYLH